MKYTVLGTTGIQVSRISTLDTKQSAFFDHHDGKVTKLFMGLRDEL